MSAAIPGVGIPSDFVITSSASTTSTPIAGLKDIFFFLFLGYLVYKLLQCFFLDIHHPIAPETDGSNEPKARTEGPAESATKLQRACTTSATLTKLPAASCFLAPTRPRPDTWRTIHGKSIDGNDFEDILAEASIHTLRNEVMQVFTIIPHHEHRFLTGEEYVKFMILLVSPVDTSDSESLSSDPSLWDAFSMLVNKEDQKRLTDRDIWKGMNAVLVMRKKVIAMLHAQRQVRDWAAEIGLVFNEAHRLDDLVERIKYLLRD